MIKIDKDRKLYKQEGKCGAFQVILPYMTAGKMMQKYLPFSWGEGFLFYKNNYLWAAFYEDQWRKVSESFLNKFEDGGVDDWLKDWNILDKELTLLSYEIYKTDLSSIDIEDLIKRYNEIYKKDLEMWACGIFIDSFDIGIDHEEIEKISNNYKFGIEEKQSLLIPDEPSFITLWDKKLSDLKNGIITRDELKKLFFWYGIDYSSFSEVDDEFIDLELQKLDESKIIEAPDKKLILKKYGLDKNPYDVFVLLTKWRDERKRLNYVGLFGMLKILRELAKRQKIDLKLLNGLIPDRVEELFFDTVAENDLKKRIEEGFFVHMTEDGEYNYYFSEEGQKCWKMVEQVLNTQESKNIDLKGSVACKGLVKGRVRVIFNPHSEDAKKMEEGEILVTSMTRPEFLPFMKIAGAFVTDEGGISSHAAIVAREMKKPCIIGTKIATKVLKDGDLVEVDANNGVVRILSK
jgi:pyruvate,water dikinase